MRLVIVLFAIGCASDVDDGFGERCEPIEDGRIYTTCESTTGIVGICAVGVCRRFCADDGTCPAGQQRVPGVGNVCWCEP